MSSATTARSRWAARPTAWSILSRRFSLTGTEFGGTHFAHPLDNDNLNDSFQINNSVKYLSPHFAGFRFGALYGFSNQAGGFTNNRAYSFGNVVCFGTRGASGPVTSNSTVRAHAGTIEHEWCSHRYNRLVPAGRAHTDRCAFRRAGQQSEDLWRWRELHLRPAVAGFVYRTSKFAQFFRIR
ncbi:porin [Caballeronia sp. NK8]|uniref:porin n=1 Tax=Caballeronia sp. NK8 TaxID=140098 RepID=UPI001CEDEB3A|nr:porin [Caballeronia sp. NK8]